MVGLGSTVLEDKFPECQIKVERDGTLRLTSQVRHQVSISVSPTGFPCSNIPALFTRTYHQPSTHQSVIYINLVKSIKRYIKEIFHTFLLRNICNNFHNLRFRTNPLNMFPRTIQICFRPRSKDNPLRPCIRERYRYSLQLDRTVLSLRTSPIPLPAPVRTITFPSATSRRVVLGSMDG